MKFYSFTFYVLTFQFPCELQSIRTVTRIPVLMEGNAGCMLDLIPVVALSHFLDISAKMRVCVMFMLHCGLHIVPFV